MEPIKFRKSKGPEAIIQQQIIKFLELRGWHVMVTHGNEYQNGFPDLYCHHPMYRQRWIEVKNPKSYKFQPSQRKNFPLMGGVWILVAATEEEYAKLWKPENWYWYLSCLR